MVGKRSPSHPAFDLETALDRAQQFYERESFNWTPVNVAMEHWGYTSTSSSGLRAVAGLLHYGLLEEDGTGPERRVRLSDLAKAILLDKREGSRERKEAIRFAALSPRLFSLLWDQWKPELPSDATMEYDLVRKLEFNPKSVRAFIEDFRATIEFAGLTKAGILENETYEHAQGLERELDSGPSPRPRVAREAHSMPSIGQTESAPWDLVVPLISGRRAVLRLPIPLSVEDYDLLTSFLETALVNMRQAIIGRGAVPPSSTTEVEED